MGRIPGEFLCFCLKGRTEWCKAEQLTLTPVWKSSTVFSATAFDWQCSHILAPFITRFLPVTIGPCAPHYLHGEFLLMTAAGLLFAGPGPAVSTFRWRTRTAICLKELIPAARLNLWKTHHCSHFRHVCPFRNIFLGCFFCSNLCYLSQNKMRTKFASALNLHAGLFRWRTPRFSAGNLSGDE